jgi:hypothetical protein
MKSKRIYITAEVGKTDGLRPWYIYIFRVDDQTQVQIRDQHVEMF